MMGAIVVPFRLNNTQPLSIAMGRIRYNWGIPSKCVDKCFGIGRALFFSSAPMGNVSYIRNITFFAAVNALAEPSRSPLSPTNIFAPLSTPAQSIFDLSLFVLEVTAAIFLVVFSLLVYAAVRFRKKKGSAQGKEPTQVYGSVQLELAWTVIPVLIVVVLFLASARVIGSVQNADPPANAIQVTVIGHQFWWEYRYPSLGVITANELHIPVSDPE